jgi:hypothetical protein
MGYPTQGRIAEDVEYIKQLSEVIESEIKLAKKLVEDCESEIDRVKQLAVRNGELLREILSILGEKNVSR